MSKGDQAQDSSYTDSQQRAWFSTDNFHPACSLLISVPFSDYEVPLTRASPVIKGREGLWGS